MFELIANFGESIAPVFAFQRIYFDLQVDEFTNYMRGYGNLFKPFSPLHNIGGTK